MDVTGLEAHVTDSLAAEWGRKVLERRVGLGLTLQQLAAKLGDRVSVQAISKIERGELVPRDYLKLALALALDREVSALFPMPPRREIRRFADATTVA